MIVGYVQPTHMQNVMGCFHSYEDTARQNRLTGFFPSFFYSILLTSSLHERTKYYHCTQCKASRACACIHLYYQSCCTFEPLVKQLSLADVLFDIVCLFIQFWPFANCSYICFPDHVIVFSPFVVLKYLISYRFGDAYALLSFLTYITCVRCLCALMV